MEKYTCGGCNRERDGMPYTVASNPTGRNPSLCSSYCYAFWLANERLKHHLETYDVHNNADCSMCIDFSAEQISTQKQMKRYLFSLATNRYDSVPSTETVMLWRGAIFTIREGTMLRRLLEDTIKVMESGRTDCGCESINISQAKKMAQELRDAPCRFGDEE